MIWIRGWRVSQEMLGELGGLHRTYVSDLERDRDLSLVTMARLAGALGVEVAAVVGRASELQARVAVDKPIALGYAMGTLTACQRMR